MKPTTIYCPLTENPEMSIIQDDATIRHGLSKHAAQLGVCRCPKCDGPMTARCGRGGPYFHCLCWERGRASRLPLQSNKEPVLLLDQVGLGAVVDAHGSLLVETEIVPM